MNSPLDNKTMPADALRVAALAVYLAVWIILALGVLAGAIPSRSKSAESTDGPLPGAVAGTVLQFGAILLIVMTMDRGALRPGPFRSSAVLILAPSAAALYIWALRSAAPGLVTSGAYRWLRHPIYAGFLAMLLATGLLASSGWLLVPAVALYVAGSEIRIASEESDLLERYPDTFPLYRRRTRWRYLPGVR